MMLSKRIVCVAGVLVGLWTAGVQAQSSSASERAQGSEPSGFSLGPTFDYSSGKFGGSQATDVLSVGVQGRYESGPWTLRASVPYLRIESPGNVVPSGGGGVTQICRSSNSGPGKDTGIRCEDSSSGGGSSTSARTRESGIGDVTLGASYNLVDDKTSGLVFDVTGKVKLPTADEKKGLGSGKTDYSIQGDLDKQTGNSSVFGTLGYKVYGDPAGINLRNVVFGGVGTSYRPSRASSVGVAYDYRQATFTGGKSLNEVSLFTSYRVTNATRFRAYVFKGLTDGGPDWGVGASLLVSF